MNVNAKLAFKASFVFFKIYPHAKGFIFILSCASVKGNKEVDDG